jgi:hypothetical protein
MAEVRKIGAQDLQIGEGTVESPGGVTVQGIDARHIPIAAGTANDAVTGYSDIVFSVEDALGAMVDVRAHGATGDGVTDDTDAVLAALVAAAGNPVYFSSGTYLLSTMTSKAASMPETITIVGAGRDSVTLDGGGDQRFYLGTTDPILTVKGVTFENWASALLWLLSAGSNPAQRAGW